MYHDPYSDAIRTLTLLKKLAAAPSPYEDERLKDLWAAPLQWEENSRARSPSYFESLKLLPHSPTSEYIQLLPDLHKRYRDYETLYTYRLPEHPKYTDYDKLAEYLRNRGYASVGYVLRSLADHNISIVDEQGTPVSVPAANFLAPFLLNDHIIDSILKGLDPNQDRDLVQALITLRRNRSQIIQLTLNHLKRKYLANLSSAPIDPVLLRTITSRIAAAEVQLSKQEINDVLDVASRVIQTNINTSRRFAPMVEYLLIERILDLDAQGKDIEPLVKLIAHGYSLLSQDEREALQALAKEKLVETGQGQLVNSNQIDLNDPYYITTLALGIPLTLLGIGLLATRFSGVGVLLLLPGLFSLFAAALGKENVKRIFASSPSEQVPQEIPVEEVELAPAAYSKKDILSVKPEEFLDHISLNRYSGDWQGVGEAFLDLTAFVLYRLEKKDLNDFIQKSPITSISDVNPDDLINRIEPFADRLVSGFESIWDTLSDETKRRILDGETIKELVASGGIPSGQVPVKQLKFNKRWLYSSRFRIRFGRFLGHIIEDFQKNAPAAAGYSPTVVGLVNFMSDIPLLGSAVQSAIPGIVRYKQAYQAIETLKSIFRINVWNQDPTLLRLLVAIDWNNLDKLQNVLQPGGQS